MGESSECLWWDVSYVGKRVSMLPKFFLFHSALTAFSRKHLQALHHLFYFRMYFTLEVDVGVEQILDKKNEKKIKNPN